MRVFYLLFAFNLLFLGEAKINAAAESESDDKVYIVYMGKTSALRSDYVELVSELKKRKKADSVLHTYYKSFLGFAARLSAEEANSIAQRPGVVSVFPDQVSQLHTTRSWDFLMSQTPAFIINGSTIPPSVSNWSTGADTIIGIIDSGIWPEHPSFNDNNMGPIPQRWRGVCMPGENSTHPVKCNRKLIGARFYEDVEEPRQIYTPRDQEGHGTHVASIAAGKPVWGASYKGLAKGIARGGSPGSRIAVYRACDADVYCVGSSILKAFDDATADGVDVISVSIGFVTDDDLLSNPNSIGAFHAMEKGITVVCSTGNKGPSPGTVGNFAPWIVTVAATTIDREFEAIIVLGGRNKKIKGGGINFSGLNKSAVYPLVDGRSVGSNLHNASNCIPGSLDGAKVKGKIILCERTDHTAYVDEVIDSLMKQGAVGVIMIEEILRKIAYDYGTTPFASVSEADGVQIRSYINSTRKPLATILPTVTALKQNPAPVVPYFSSRGPTPAIKNLLKPDVAAPGEDILGAALPSSDTEPPPFRIDSGTSMSCPHVSGLAATVKSRHPAWSPSAIKSAIMTTAIDRNDHYAPITTDNGSRVTPYDIGAGEINIIGPMCPGLVYETKSTDYVQFLCNMGYNASVIKYISSTVPSNFDCPSDSSADLIPDMNYPSIAVSGLKANGSRTVKRTVTNVGGEEYPVYTATVKAPDGIQIKVVPHRLLFSKAVNKRSFQVTFKLTKAYKETLFGSITWSNGMYMLRLIVLQYNLPQLDIQARLAEMLE